MKPLIIFNIRNQIINRVDTFKIVSDSRNYLQAQFNFITDDWNGTKTAIFGGEGGANVILDEDNTCLVPWEWLATSGRKPVSVFCGDRVTANTAMCEIRPSGYTEQDAPEPPTPDVYAQLIGKYDEVKGSVPTELKQLESDSTHRTVTDEEKESWNSKSDFSGNYDDLENKPTIPKQVTESDIAKMGFTKNTGNYSKPDTGIPESDLSEDVQTKLNSGVTSVNGKTGVVVLKAKDVGALPEDTDIPVYDDTEIRKDVDKVSQDLNQLDSRLSESEINIFDELNAIKMLTIQYYNELKALIDPSVIFAKLDQAILDVAKLG